MREYFAICPVTGFFKDDHAHERSRMFQVIPHTPNNLTNQHRILLIETALERKCEEINRVYRAVRMAEDAISARDVQASERSALITRAHIMRRRFDKMRLSLPSHLRNGRN